jgi:hypothetical protein
MMGCRISENGGRKGLSVALLSISLREAAQPLSEWPHF